MEFVQLRQPMADVFECSLEVIRTEGAPRSTEALKPLDPGLAIEARSDVEIPADRLEELTKFRRSWRSMPNRKQRRDTQDVTSWNI